MEREFLFWSFVGAYLLIGWAVGLFHHYAMIRWADACETRAFWAALLWPGVITLWGGVAVAAIVLWTAEVVGKAARK